METLFQCFGGRTSDASSTDDQKTISDVFYIYKKKYIILHVVAERIINLIQGFYLGRIKFLFIERSSWSAKKQSESSISNSNRNYPVSDTSPALPIPNVNTALEKRCFSGSLLFYTDKTSIPFPDKLNGI